MLNVWIPAISPMEKDNLPLACLIASFCLVFWQQMGPQAVSCLHPNQSSPRSPHLPAQGASVSTRYYVSYTLLHLFLPQSAQIHTTFKSWPYPQQHNSLCWKWRMWPITKGCRFRLYQDVEQQIIGLFLALELLMCARGHPCGSEERTWPWACITLWKISQVVGGMIFM